MKKLIIPMIVLILLAMLVYSDITPRDDYDFRSYFNLWNVKNFNVTHNATIGNNLSVINYIDTYGLCLQGDCRIAWSGVTPTITYLNVTTTTHTGNITNGSAVGYNAANIICNTEHPGTHMCTPDDIFNFIDNSDYIIFIDYVTGWVIEGPPGYTSNSNDCLGLTSSENTYLGAFWDFTDNTDGGGTGWLTNCANSKPLVCCK